MFFSRSKKPRAVPLSKGDLEGPILYPRMRFFACIVCCLLMSLSLWGQANAVDADYASKTISPDSSAHPDATSDSTACNADDFVIASLLVADPGGKIYSVMGHACIRMQCPAYGLDYCFSYESEDVAHRVIDFFAGKLYMGMFAVPKEEYCASYREEGRGVYEYTLNLPIEIKRELWRILDEEMLKG